MLGMAQQSNELSKTPSLHPYAEFPVTKPNKTSGHCDLVLPVGNYLIVTEWKAIPIDFLDIPEPTEISQKVTRATGASDEQILREEKASVLSEYSCSKALDMKFGKNDKFHTGKLRKWIIDKVAPQLKSYIMSEEVKKLQGDLSLKAHIIVVIGSRQILVWDMYGDGKLVKAPILVGQKASGSGVRGWRPMCDGSLKEGRGGRSLLSQFFLSPVQLIDLGKSVLSKSFIHILAIRSKDDHLFTRLLVTCEV